MLGTAAAIGLALAGVGVGYVVYKQVKKGSVAAGGPLVEDVLDAGGTLADAPGVVADVKQIVSLTSAMPEAAGFSYAPTVALDNAGVLQNMSSVSFGAGDGGVPDERSWNGRTTAGAVVSGQVTDGPKAIAALVTGVTGDFAAQLYEWSLNEIANKEAAWDDAPMRDATIRAVLKRVMPREDFASGTLGAFGSPKSKVWGAAQLLGAVAWQSYWNKKV